MEVFSFEIKLYGDSEFAKRFSAASAWFARWKRLGTDEAFNDWVNAKYALEQGLPIFELPDALSLRSGGGRSF